MLRQNRKCQSKWLGVTYNTGTAGDWTSKCFSWFRQEPDTPTTLTDWSESDSWKCCYETQRGWTPPNKYDSNRHGNNRNLDVYGTFTGTKWKPEFITLCRYCYLSQIFKKHLSEHWSYNWDDLKSGGQFTALKCMSQRQIFVSFLCHYTHSSSTWC